LVGILFVCPANADILNFDDLVTDLSYDPGGFTINYGQVPNIYEAFNWTGWEVIGNGDMNKYPSNLLQFPSASNAVYPGNGYNTVTSSGQIFNFQGAYLGSWVGGEAQETHCPLRAISELRTKGLKQ